MTRGQTHSQTPSGLLDRVHGIPATGVLRRYDLPDPVDAQTLHRVEQGLLNRGLRVSGPHGTYFLKQYLDDAGHATGSAIAAQHRAIAALRDRGLPTAPPLAARDGRTFVLLRGRRYALFPWIKGEHRTGRSLDHEQCAALGTLLGRVHTALAEIQPPVSQPAAVPSADPADTERTISELLDRARRRLPQEPFDALARERLRQRRELLAAHGHRRPQPEAAPPTGWVHGDFHPLNLLYRDRTPVAVLDWDRLGLRPRTEEAVRAATLFFHHAETGVLDLPRLRQYARAYRDASGSSAEQVAAGVHRVWWERLNDFWMLRWRYQRRDVRADPLFPAAAAQLVWWCEEYEQVLDAYVN
ncbi:Ser/Thr protein kinase RdoA (MazF antagonist) [Streptacidiphilus sp. MAP12-16]|uniref:phosphotransferase enzyme family protein n=1 Tax=Streptacidiphilus sp. MAP12-16 TaxID=3156300 RepID=UPI0035187C46